MKITLSKSQWEFIGEKTGWIKSAQPGERCPRCNQPMQKHPLSKTHEQYKDIKQCPRCFMNYSPNAPKYEGSWAWEQQKRKNMTQQAQLIKKTYFYHINLNERGQFYADVRDEKDNTIFEIKGFEIFKDGFMTNVKDMNGLKNYLVNLSLISKQDELKYVG
jgi:hypothetical protein